jgi:mannose-1-phosphate guanylyltransferase
VSTSLYAVILAGGGGTRLWPASRRQRPKQFLPLAPGGHTLLGATVARVLPLTPLDRILVVTAADQAAEVRAALPDLPTANILCEPVARNTAPAITLAAVELKRRGAAESVMAVLPSDHVVTDDGAFRRVLAEAAAAADRYLVTVGIQPTRPETGYGYLELIEGSEGPARPVARFVEKPDLARAREYLAARNYLWNSGMFFFRADRLLAEVERHLPDVAKAVPDRYAAAPSISIDYGVMEKASGIYAVPGDFGWNDVGSWAALADLHPPDPQGNVRVGGDMVAVAASGNLVVGKGLVAMVGVEGLAVVVTEDAVLILPREQAQDVRQVVAELERRGAKTYL